MFIDDADADTAAVFLFLFLLCSHRTAELYIQANENFDLCTWHIWCSSKSFQSNGHGFPLHFKRYIQIKHRRKKMEPHNIWIIPTSCISRISLCSLCFNTPIWEWMKCNLSICVQLSFARDKREDPSSRAMLIVYIIIMLFTIVWHHFHSFLVGIWFVIFFFFQLISNNLFSFPAQCSMLIVCLFVDVDDWIRSLCVPLLIFMLSFVHAFHKHWAFDLHLFNFQIKWCRQSLFRLLLLLHFTLEKKFWSCFFSISRFVSH